MAQSGLFLLLFPLREKRFFLIILKIKLIFIKLYDPSTKQSTLLYIFLLNYSSYLRLVQSMLCHLHSQLSPHILQAYGFALIPQPAKVRTA